ncbi:poly(rC)-binding protein 3-like isoform X5 [Dinothrombium tinctorium]|uniref:Poly(RC)-binding protein 3-like isoform X5 n=1 Tax=Dinothrombium tinctorium TaxID=1965070 RepID=A0A443RRF1_9ACAR|nr:poly(rC)-binding protein 3-like isoform X5 [Dinothrombium tinctorium]
MNRKQKTREADEVGSIIGKKGDNIKKFREESGAKINISDGSCPERIVTVTGSTEAILKAFSLISRKFEEDVQNSTTPGTTVPKPQVTLRLIVPASQCGSLIGKGGAKIKEIREITGATIQVASEMLPNSTERAVTISGNSESITKCIYQICCVMMESPPKGATIPYRPKPAMPPVIFAGGQAYTIQGQYAIPHPDGFCDQQCHAGLVEFPATMGLIGNTAVVRVDRIIVYGLYILSFLVFPQLTKLHQLALQHAPLLPGHNVGTLNPQALATLAATNSIRAGAAAATALASAAATTTEMTIPNDLIGCIIGKGGAKINEIRQLSGATIKISNSEEGSKDRTVTISGTPESINLAQYLINTSMELHKNLTLDPTSNPSSTATTMTLTSTPMAIPLTQLVKPSPLALATVPSAAATLFATTDLNNFSNQTRIKPLTTKLRATTTGLSTTPGLENGSKAKADRKFTPY